MIDEGYIKYQCHWTKQDAVAGEEITALNQWRNKLYQLGLIGQYDSGIGFGNISYRINRENNFIISGTQTGGIAQLTAQHYTKVINYSWEQNYVTCIGAIKASSESLTHGALYVANPEINAVVHVHHLQLWQKLLDNVPTTHPDRAYGTPEMALEIIELCQNRCQQQPIVVMSGHREGIITFGKNLDEAGNTLLSYYQKFI